MNGTELAILGIMSGLLIGLLVNLGFKVDKLIWRQEFAKEDLETIIGKLNVMKQQNNEIIDLLYTDDDYCEDCIAAADNYDCSSCIHNQAWESEDLNIKNKK